MAKKKAAPKVSHLEIVEAISTGASTCPGCGAEWTDPVDDKGKPIKNPPNQVMIHADDCAAREGEPRG
jgi:hypothetical protein